MTAIYNDGEGINITVEVELVPDGVGHHVRYDLRIYDLNGNSEANISAFRVYHDTAYTLMKLAGVPWREANRVLDYAYNVAIGRAS